MTAAAIFPWLSRLLAVLAVLATLYGVDQRAEQRGRLDAQVQQLTQGISLYEQSIQKSSRLAGLLGQFIDQHQEEKANAQQAILSLGRDLRSGAIRLHVRTASAPAASGGPHGAAPGPGQTHAELDPADAAALLDLTAQGDDAIRDLNACIDRYNAVQQTVNAAP